jgi:hypothetical protein
MSRSLSYLRRGFLGIAVAASLGFGASTALAASDPIVVLRPPICPDGTVTCCYEWGCLECVEQGSC